MFRKCCLGASHPRYARPLNSKADSTSRFLFAVLQLDRICVARTVTKIKIALDSMPSELDDLYQQTIERIRTQNNEDRELGMRVLSLVTHARRPLHVGEIQHALAVDVEAPTSDLDFDNILPPQSLTDLCAGLVVIETNSQIIRLVHYTTQEFFDRKRHTLFEDAERDISRVCLTYLSYDMASEFPTEQYIRKKQATYRFLEYAALHWLSHVQRSKDYTTSGLTFKKAVSYIKDVKKTSFMAMLLHRSLLPRSPISDADLLARRETLPLEAAAACGLLELVGFLIAYNESSKDTAALGTALCHASSRGHIEVARFLLTQDPPVAYGCVHLNTALMAACHVGHLELAELLISHKADANAWDEWGEKAILHWAAGSGNTELIALLLREGANPLAQDPGGRTACHTAAQWGYSEMVSLLTQGTTPHLWPLHRSYSVLQAAAYGGHLDIVSLLLSQGFDPMARNDRNETARDILLNERRDYRPHGDCDRAEIEAVFAPYLQASSEAEVPTMEPSTADEIPESSED